MTSNRVINEQSNMEIVNEEDDWIENPPLQLVNDQANSRPPVISNVPIERKSFVQKYRPTQSHTKHSYSTRSSNQSNYNKGGYNQSNNRRSNIRSNTTNVNSRYNYDHNSKRSSSVYMRNNELIIGSQHGSQVQNIVANNKRDLNTIEIYLGNVIPGTSFRMMRSMLNLMNIRYSELSQLNNRHGYFQSYYFKVPKDKVNVVFDPLNWQKGLIVREFV